jgi:hypothetical protein
MNYACHRPYKSLVCQVDGCTHRSDLHCIIHHHRTHEETCPFMECADVEPIDDGTGVCYTIDLCIRHYAWLDRYGEQSLQLKPMFTAKW